MDWLTETTLRIAAAAGHRPGTHCSSTRPRRSSCSTSRASPRTTAASGRTRRCLCFVLGQAVARGAALDDLARGDARRLARVSELPSSALTPGTISRDRSRRARVRRVARRERRARQRAAHVPASRLGPHRGHRRGRRAGLHRSRLVVRLRGPCVQAHGARTRSTRRTTSRRCSSSSRQGSSKSGDRGPGR